MHLDKECPLKKEVNRAKEAKYGEFRRPFLNNSGHGWYRVSAPGYNTRVDNSPQFGEKKPSLEDTINRHIEGSTRKIVETEE
ncbi:hypothetical protein Tco_1325960 [Tanacetum coccineum]